MINFFKPITVTITRDEYNDLHDYKNSTQEYIYELWNEKRRLLKLYTEIQEELEQSQNNLQEKQEYCDYLELESNKTEERLKQTIANRDFNFYFITNTLFPELEKAGKELKAKDKMIEKVRVENDRLGGKLRIAESKLENSFEATLSRGIKVLSEAARDASKGLRSIKPIITKGKYEDGEYTDKTYILAKICTKCQEQKPLDQFHKQVGKKGGVRSWCKECRKLK